MNRMNTAEVIKNNMDSLHPDNEVQFAQLTDAQKLFIEKCTLFISALTVENLHLKPKMSFDEIRDRVHESGLTSIFSEYDKSRFWGMFLFDDGTILIQNPSDKGTYTQPYYFSNDIGVFEFVDNGSIHCDLFATNSTRCFAEIIHDTNDRSKNECLQKLYDILHKLAPNYDFKQKNVFPNPSLQMKEPARMDFYIMPERGELDSVCFDDGTSAFIGYEYANNNLSCKNRGWTGMTYKKVDFMGNIRFELLSEEMSGSDADNMANVIISLFAHEPYKIYPHQVDVICGRQPGGSMNYFKRDILIDKACVISEKWVDKRCDPYLQNKKPLIKIMQDVAEVLCKLPDEKTVKKVIESKPDNIYQAVNVELIREHDQSSETDVKKGYESYENRKTTSMNVGGDVKVLQCK